MRLARRFRLSIVAIGGIAVMGGAATGQALSVPDILGAYVRGAYVRVFEALGREGAVDGDFFKTFDRDASRWVRSADPAIRARRALVAATVALELAHLLREHPADRAGRYLVWASLLMRDHEPARPTPTERLWYLAALAGMQELDEPWVLSAGRATGSAVLAPIARRLGAGGHLAAALRRFPDEPRFKLAAVGAEACGARHAFSPSYVGFLRDDAAARGAGTPQRGGQVWATRSNGHGPCGIRAAPANRS